MCFFPKGWNRRPANQHQYLENASVALKAIEEDGIKLVNIGKIQFDSIKFLLQKIGSN